MNSTPINFHGQSLELLPERAIYWRDQQTLILADLHLGKAATFRARGLPVPHGTTARDLALLSQLVTRFSPTRVIVVGDLIHAAESLASLQSLRAWKAAHPTVTVQLVLGNHDRHIHAEQIAETVDLLNDPHAECGLHFTHIPLEIPLVPSICGHIHPAVTLRDFDGSGVSVPCFVIDPMQIILPSFGGFTGKRVIAPQEARRRYAAAAGRVVCVP